MGNSWTQCCVLAPARGRIKVYTEKGRLLQFIRPLTASELMREHPNHVIVYSGCKAKQTEDGEGKVSKPYIQVLRPGYTLHMGRVYFLVHVPEQHKANFAKCFDAQSPSASPHSTVSSASASPLSAYIPSPLSGSSPDSEGQAKQQPTLVMISNPEKIRRPRFSRQRPSLWSPRIPITPATPGMMSDEDRRRSEFNNHIRKRRPSLFPRIPITPTQDSTTEHCQEDQSASTQDSGKSGSPGTKSTSLRSFLQEEGSVFQEEGSSPKFSEKSPETSVKASTEATPKSNVQQKRWEGGISPYYSKGISPFYSNKGLGKAVTPSTDDMVRTIVQPKHQQRQRQSYSKKGTGTSAAPSFANTRRSTLRHQLQQQRSTSPYYSKGISPYYSKKSPRSCRGPEPRKPSRPRRDGVRSAPKPPFFEPPPLLSNKRNNLHGDDIVSCLPGFFGKLHTKKKAKPKAPVPLRAPPLRLGASILNRIMPRLTGNPSVRSSWAPSLVSISEDSPERGNTEHLIKSFTPSHFLHIPYHTARQTL